MDAIDYMLVFGAGLASGFINTIAGGGSLLTLPVLIFMGLPPAVANGTNRLSILMQSAFAVSGFKSKGVSDFRYSIWLAVSSVIGAVIGARIAIDIQGEVFNKILAVVMVLVILVTVFNPLKKKVVEVERIGTRQQIITVILFFFVGIYGGFIQAGVGFVIIAVLTLVNHYSLVKTNSIKVFVVFVYTVFALGVFIWEEQVEWIAGSTMAAGSALGGWVTSRWSVAGGEKYVRYFLIIAVLALSFKLWFFPIGG